MFSRAEIKRNGAPHYVILRHFLIPLYFVAHFVIVLDFKE